MEGPNINNQPEKNREPFLEELWAEYGFKGEPPFAGSVAEARLKEVCNRYADFVDFHKNELPAQQALVYGSSSSNKKFIASESGRRELHNQIAIMVVGKQRSGMEGHMAKHIAGFAYEYSRGYKVAEAEKYEKQNGGIK